MRSGWVVIFRGGQAHRSVFPIDAIHLCAARLLMFDEGPVLQFADGLL